MPPACYQLRSGNNHDFFLFLSLTLFLSSSLNSVNSSDSRSSSSHSHSPTSHFRYRGSALPQQGSVRLPSVSSHDSGFTSQDTCQSKSPSPMPPDGGVQVRVNQPCIHSCTLMRTDPETHFLPVQLLLHTGLHHSFFPLLISYKKRLNTSGSGCDTHSRIFLNMCIIAALPHAYCIRRREPVIACSNEYALLRNHCLLTLPWELSLVAREHPLLN